ncbi:MAG: hypothetical protein EOR94_13300 [Mesorhizobium sp.]|nr:MAG: hypothetical protein EOR94_13300 [Mesorhizobium sp.]
MAVQFDAEREDAMYQALIQAYNSVPATNGEAGVAFLMFFAELSRKNPHFLPIVLASWSRDKGNPEGAVQ